MSPRPPGAAFRAGRAPQYCREVSRYRWALRPGWILSHIFVLGCVVAFVNLGFWQVHRLQERRDANALITARQATAPAPLAQVLAPDATGDAVTAATYRQVTVTGTYRTEDQVLIRNRTNGGAPGFRVVTPLVLDDGHAVAIDRGWIPLHAGDGDGASPALYAPPSGAVTVTGIVRETQRQEGLGVSDPPTGTVPALARVDVPRLQQQVSLPLYPVYVELTAQQPPQTAATDNIPSPVPPPPLDDGPHLSYAGQWFIFATLTTIVYPLLLRRNAKHREADALDAAEAAAAAAAGVTTPDERELVP